MIIKLSQKKEQDPSRFQATSCQIHQGKNRGSNYCLRLVDERPQGRPGYIKNKQVLFQQKQIFVMSCLPSDMSGLGFCCCCCFLICHQGPTPGTEKAIWQDPSSCHFQKIIQFILVRINLLKPTLEFLFR